MIVSFLAAAGGAVVVGPLTTVDGFLLLSLGLFILAQMVLVGRFAAICGRPAPPRQQTPPAARVILCLRGSDPFLSETLRAITSQTYPDYELVIIVDSPGDPAWKQVQQTLATLHPLCPVRIEPLRERPTCSSLKCASILQGLESLPDQVGLVALLDADVVPAVDWLAALAARLSADTWAVTGNRWYLPPDGGLGGWTRAAWNAGAIVQMVCFGIPWGGSLAMSRRLADTADFRGHLATGFCEDTPLSGILLRYRKTLAFGPELIAINREDCTLRSALPWIARQLLTARLYHPAWPLVAIHALLPPLLMLGSLAAAWWAISRGQPWLAAAHLTLVVVFLVSLPLLFLWIQRTVGRAAPAVLHASAPGRLVRLWNVLRGIALAQLTYPIVLLQAAFLRRCRWRGVQYDIAGPQAIRLLSDAASDEAQHPAGLHSL